MLSVQVSGTQIRQFLEQDIFETSKSGSFQPQCRCFLYRNLPASPGRIPLLQILFSRVRFHGLLKRKRQTISGLPSAVRPFAVAFDRAEAGGHDRLLPSCAVRCDTAESRHYRDNLITVYKVYNMLVFRTGLTILQFSCTQQVHILFVTESKHLIFCTHSILLDHVFLKCIAL